ncbi:MAG: NAD(+)/NADH kinase, partial [Nitrospinales bacterium]
MGRAKNIGIFCRQKPAVKREILAGLTEWLRKRNHKVLMPPETAAILGETSSCKKSEIPSQAQHIIVLGGDGTLLTVARTAYPHKIPITAVNLGSLGFLTEFSLPNLYEGLE